MLDEEQKMGSELIEESQKKKRDRINKKKQKNLNKRMQKYQKKEKQAIKELIKNK